MNVCTNCSRRAEQRVAQIVRARAAACRRHELAGGIDGAAGVDVLVAPLADRVEILEREPERIDHAVALVAGWHVAVGFQPLAHGERHAAFLRLDEGLHARRRRRGRRAEEFLENVRAAQHRRGAVRVGRRHEERALAEQPVR